MSKKRNSETQYKEALKTINPRELRIMFAHCSPHGGWYRLMADVKKVNLPVSYETFKVIREHLVRLKSLRLQ